MRHSQPVCSQLLSAKKHLLSTKIRLETASLATPECFGPRQRASESEAVYFQVCREEPSVVSEPQRRPALKRSHHPNILWFLGLLWLVTARSIATTTVTNNLGA